MLSSLPIAIGPTTSITVHTIGTVGTVQSGYMSGEIFAGTIGTIQSGNVDVSAIGTIGTITSPVSIGQVFAIGTVGTIQSGNISVSVIATIGTITSPQTVLLPTATVIGTAGVQKVATISGTLRATGGTLYGVVASSEAAAGTLLLIHSQGILMKLIVPSNDVRGFTFDKGVAYSGSLIASIVGKLTVAVLS